VGKLENAIIAFMQKMARVIVAGGFATPPVDPKAKIFPKKRNFGIIKP
jgi:hypothetical protein